MAGHRRLRRGAGGLEVADLADHHHVRVVAENRAETFLEGHAHLVVHRDLVHAVEMVFHGVLDGEHLDGGADNRVERGVERGGLAGTGRAGDEEDAVRPVDQALEHGVRRVVHTQLLEREEHVRLVQETHDDALAEEHRDDAHAHVHLTAAHLELDAAVLRDAALGDVEVGEDLDAADDRGLEPVHLGRHGGLLQDAVDPVADRDLVLVRFDVDVRGPLVDRLDDDLVDQLDDARLLGHLEQVLAALDRGSAAGQVVGPDHLVQGVAAEAEVGLDQLLDVVPRREHRLDVETGAEPQVVEDVEVEGVAGGDVEDAVLARDGDEALPVDHLRRQRPKDLRRDDDVRELDERQMQLVGHQLQHLALGEEPELDDRAVEPQPLRTLQGDGVAELLFGQQAVDQQKLGEVHGFRWKAVGGDARARLRHDGRATRAGRSTFEEARTTSATVWRASGDGAG